MKWPIIVLTLLFSSTMYTATTPEKHFSYRSHDLLTPEQMAYIECQIDTLERISRQYRVTVRNLYRDFSTLLRKSGLDLKKAQLELVAIQDALNRVNNP